MLSGLLLGCAGASKEYYINNIHWNVTIKLTTDIPEGFFYKSDIVAGVNDVNPDCSVDYKGMIELKPGENTLGLQPGKLTYLAVEIMQKNSLASSTSTMMRGTMLKPVAGRQYEIIVSYMDNMFDFRVFETGSKRRQLELMPMGMCKPHH